MKFTTLKIVHDLLVDYKEAARSTQLTAAQDAERARREGDIEAQPILEEIAVLASKQYLEAKDALEDFESLDW